MTACGGLYVGRLLAERLSLPLLDREVLTGAARLLRADEARLTGRDERRSTFWERFLSTFSAGTPETPYVPPPFPFVEDEELFSAEAAVIRRAAAESGAVIIGHGAATVLRGDPGLLRVFCHAPLEFRARRLLELYGLSGVSEARATVESMDRKRERYLKEVSGIDWRDSGEYDLCINTAKTGFTQAVDLIAGLVEGGTLPDNPDNSSDVTTSTKQRRK